MEARWGWGEPESVVLLLCLSFSPIYPNDSLRPSTTVGFASEALTPPRGHGHDPPQKSRLISSYIFLGLVFRRRFPPPLLPLYAALSPPRVVGGGIGGEEENISLFLFLFFCALFPS